MASQKAVAVQKRGSRKKMGMKVKENLYQAVALVYLDPCGFDDDPSVSIRSHTFIYRCYGV